MKTSINPPHQELDDDITIRPHHHLLLLLPPPPPLHLPLSHHLRRGVINLKRPHPHNTLTLIKTLLNLTKIQPLPITHPSSQNLILCLQNSASLRHAPTDHLCVAHLPADPTDIRRALSHFPTSHKIFCHLLDFDRKSHTARFRVFSDPTANIRTFFVNLGTVLGTECRVRILKRIRPVVLTENVVTLGEVVEAHRAFEEDGDESGLRRVVMPMEALLVQFKGLVVDEMTRRRVLCGAKRVFVDGVVGFCSGGEGEVSGGEEVKLMTGSGEVFGLGITVMPSRDFAGSAGGRVVACVTLVIGDGEDEYVVDEPED